MPKFAAVHERPKRENPDGSEQLTFTANSVRNTTVASDNDQFYFEVVTRYWHPKTTKINILEPDTQILRPVAEIEKVIPGRFRVRFLNSDAPGAQLGEWISDIDFLKPDPDGVGGTFEHDGVEYRWKTHNRRLQLIRTDDETKTPIVEYHPHRRYFLILRMSRHASWTVKPEALGFLDRLLVSYVLVERRRRIARELVDRVV